MKVTSALCWYDELPEDLEACIKGVANVADKILAVDGAYRRFPNAKAASPPEQADLIRKTTKMLGLECEIFVPDAPWAGQVEKRSAMMSMAAKGSDWIIVSDTDHVIRTDRLWARGTLNTLLDNPDVDVIAVSYFTPANDSRPLEVSAATNWHTSLADGRFFTPHLFRALPGIKVEKFHWWYSATKGGEKVWLWGEGGKEDGRPSLPWAYFDPAKYEVEHRCLTRDERHIIENRAFCNDRIKVVELTGQEDDVPGLPEPVYDYETLPY